MKRIDKLSKTTKSMTDTFEFIVGEIKTLEKNPYALSSYERGYLKALINILNVFTNMLKENGVYKEFIKDDKGNE